MSDRILVATRKGLFTITRSGKRWSIAQTNFLADNCSLVMHDPRDGTMLVALGHGHFGCKLHRSRDGGASWQECGAPIYPEKPDDYEEKPNPMSDKVSPWNTELIWELQPGGPDESGVYWCGTLPGGLFRSDDGGDSWELNRTLWDDPRRPEWFGGGYDYPGIHSVCVDPRDSAHLLVGVSCGGVWRTTDSGASWECNGTGMRAEYLPEGQAYHPVTQDPHILVRCHDAPDHLWVQHHNGIFRSIDNAKTWQEITDVKPSTFGFAVAVHPADPNTAWFVPAVKDEHRIPVDGKLVVTRTRDGGETFEQLTNGLPQEHAYDLVFRHALDIDETGDTLAFGSTTGSLWVSPNQGDAWQCVSAHLPPIYCVRFVKG